MMKKLVLLCLLIGYTGFSQQKIIDVYTNASQNGDVVFYADNRSKSNYALLISLSDLKNVQHGIPNTVIRTVQPGVNTLFTLRKTTTTISTTASIGYRYKYSFSKGCYNPNIDSDYNYIIPLGVGKVTEVSFLKHINSSIGKESPSEYTVYGFSASKNDTVYASRAGRVSKIERNNSIEDQNSIYSANRSFIEISHEDCSSASYKTLEKFFVKKGDVVFAGEPLGILRARSGDEAAHLIFSVFYYDIQNSSGSKISSKLKYVNVNFDVGDTFEKLKEGKYRVAHNFETVTQEMSRKEIKIYKKTKSSK